MTFAVLLTAQAETDLAELYAFLAEREGAPQADAVLDRLERAILELERLPLRGHHPPELLRIGVREFREINQGPWRVFYRLRDKDVVVYAVVDGRRDMIRELERRLLG